MSRIRKNYDRSFRARFLRYISGETELPEKDYMPDFEKQIEAEREEDEKATEHYLVPPIVDPMEDAKRYAEFSGMKWFRRLYTVMAVLLCVSISTVLIFNVIFMPSFGSADTPMNNEVSQRYLEKAAEETGTVNSVTGLILQYRGFDTFGETHVLFIATIAVMILLKRKRAAVRAGRRRYYSPDDCARSGSAYSAVRPLCSRKRASFARRRLFRRGGYRRGPDSAFGGVRIFRHGQVLR